MSMVVEQLLGFYGSTDLSRNLPDPELALWNVKDEGLVVVRIEAARQVLQTIISNFELQLEVSRMNWASKGILIDMLSFTITNTLNDANVVLEADAQQKAASSQERGLIFKGQFKSSRQSKQLYMDFKANDRTLSLYADNELLQTMGYTLKCAPTLLPLFEQLDFELGKDLQQQYSGIEHDEEEKKGEEEEKRIEGEKNKKKKKVKEQSPPQLKDDQSEAAAPVLEEA